MTTNPYLFCGACLSALAALLHVCIIFGGPSWYLFFGAGRQMADMAAAGRLYPTIVTAGLAIGLLIWAMYGLSGAGVIRPLSLLKPVLSVITCIYLLRGLAIIPIALFTAGGASAFWWWSSLICLGYGLVHLAGITQLQRSM